MAAPTTPAWLLAKDAALCPCGCIGKRRKGSYLQKTLTGGAALLRRVIFSEDTSSAAGLLQRLDPRAKVLGLIGLVVAGAFLRTVPALLVLYLLTLGLAAASRVPVGFFIKRVWLFVPIFTGIVLIPATLSVVTGGHVVLTLWYWHGRPEGFTSQGLSSAALVVCRVASSISLVVLLALTTPWTRLLASLRALGVPRMFILVIGMAYRYLFLLLGSVTDMYQARASRTIGAERHDRGARAFVSASAGALLGRTMAMSEEVHQAMTARGYRGDARVLAQPRPAAADLIFVLAAAGTAAALLIAERMLGG
jgi:cobalt ECF transporter T component CbiQ